MNFSTGVANHLMKAVALIKQKPKRMDPSRNKKISRMFNEVLP